MGTKKTEEKEISVEEAFQKIEETISSLEDEKVTLEDSFDLYREGMRLLKLCSDRIDRVEKKVLAINEKGEVNEF